MYLSIFYKYLDTIKKSWMIRITSCITYFSNSGTQEMLVTWELNVAATEASCSDKEIPALAIFKAWKKNTVYNDMFYQYSVHKGMHTHFPFFFTPKTLRWCSRILRELYKINKLKKCHKNEWATMSKLCERLKLLQESWLQVIVDKGGFMYYWIIRCTNTSSVHETEKVAHRVGKR